MGISLSSGSTALFWMATGFMAGLAAAFFAVQLWRGPLAAEATTSGFMSRSPWLLPSALAAFVLISFVVYLLVGKPGVPSSATALAFPKEMVGNTNTSNRGTPGSMQEATTRLATKLAAGGGSDADWQLLQQSYEFLGDTAAAALAKQHQLKGSSGAATAVTAPSTNSVGSNPAAANAATNNKAAIESYQQAVAKNPKDATAWLALAQLQRSARNFSEASVTFGKVIKLKAMDAGAWADYADVEASLQGSLSMPSARHAIEEALKLNAQYPKALWLKASLAHEEKRYADALQTWQKLRAAIPDSSPDAALVDANITEARQLAGLVPATASQPVATIAEVRGSVMLDASIQKQVTSDMTLFIYAKSDDSPAPVAAWRGNVKVWPMSFVLNDSNAMMPSRKLSQYSQVRIEARLSRSGQALAQSGDLQTAGIAADTRSGQPIAIRISQRVP
jgi:cytochrome c-type biogenesis protein CcmH